METEFAPPFIARVLLATDGSQRTVAGLPFLALVATRLGAHVDVVHVVDSEAGSPGLEARRKLDRTVAGLLERSAPTEGHLWLRRERSMADVIVDAVRELGPNLVVLAPHGSSSVEAVIRGSVTNDLLNLLDTPLLMLRGAPPPTLARLLVATANHSDIGPITSLAAALARPAQADALVVHVRSRGLARDVFQLLESPEEAAALAVDAVGALERLGVAARYSVELGRTHYAIVRAAQRTGADLIVLGRRRVLDWRDVLGGDVTGELVRLADRPVLVAGRAPHGDLA